MGKNKIKDLKGYTEKMQKSMEEKIIFTKYIDLNDKIVIDFGCADGSMIKCLYEKYPNTQFIGIENNPKLKEMAIENLPNDVIICESLEEYENKYNMGFNFDKPLVFIMSSVLHEINDDLFLEEDLYNYVSAAQYIVIRDMYKGILYDYFGNQKYCKAENLSKIIEHSNKKHLAQFIRKWGIGQLQHYFLKYRYVENWKTELEEDYFSAWEYVDYLNSKLDLEEIYECEYLQEFTRQQVKKDFDIDMVGLTHKIVVYKNKGEKDTHEL